MSSATDSNWARGDSNWARRGAPSVADDSNWARDAHWRDAHWR